MPPSLTAGGVWNGFKDTVIGVFTGSNNSTQTDNSKSQETPLCSTGQAPKPDEPVYPTYSNRYGDDDAELEIVEVKPQLQYSQKPQGLAVNKRKAAEEVTRRQGGRSRPNSHALRLSSDYTRPAPADAKRIYFPGEDNDWNPPKRQTDESMGGTTHRGFKPTNTLSNPSAQSAKKTSFWTDAPKHAQAPRSKQPLSTMGSRGANVASTPRFPDDVSHTEERANKRLKLDSSPVDLTLDDSQEDLSTKRAIPRHAQQSSPTVTRDPGKAISSRSSQERLSHLDNREMHTADECLGIRTGKKSKSNRRPRASAETIDGRLDGAYSPDVGSENDPVTIPDDEPPQSTNIPKIDLGRGLEEVGLRAREKKLKAGQNSAEDKANTKSVFDKFSKSSTQPKVHQRRTIPQDHTNGIRPGSQREKEARLGSTFQRDVEGDVETVRPQSTTGKAQDRMRVSSSRRPSSSDSVDELQRGNTGVAKRRSASPTKKQQPSSQNPRKLNSTYASRETSPSKFTYQATPSASKVPAKAQPLEEDAIEDFEDCLGITTIMCKACMFNDPGLGLVWNPEAKALIVTSGDSWARSLAHQGPILLREKHISKIQTHRESRIANFQGPSTATSNGHIYVEFASLGEKNTACKHFPMAKRDNREKNWLENAFQNAKAEQKQVHDAAIRQHARDVNAEWEAERQRAQPKRPRAIEAEEERIVYEDEEPEPPRKRRSMMQSGNSLADALNDEGYQQPSKSQSETISRYFEGRERRSTRASIPVHREPSPEPPDLPKWTQEIKLPPWPRSVVYPYVGTRRVTVDFKDLERLDNGEFLNDNVINYALREIEEHMEPQHKEKVHFFNTFFYTSVTTKNGRKVRECNYDGVKKWTKSVDLFNKPYIVVPINLELHWFVAIICNLDKVGRKTTALDGIAQVPDGAAFDSDTPMGNTADVAREAAQPALEIDADVSAVATDAKSEAVDSTHDEAQQDGSRPSNAKTKKTKKKLGPGPRKYDTDRLMIVSLDSFGFPRSNELKVLKQYISKEAQERRGMDLDPSEIQAMKAIGIPEQKNFYDCGVYLLEYVKAFAKDPEKFVHKLLQKEMKDDDFTLDCSRTRVDIRNKLLELQRVQEEEYQRQKKAKRDAKTPQRVANPPAAENASITKAASTVALPSPEKAAAVTSSRDVSPSKTSTASKAAQESTTALPPASQPLNGHSSQQFPPNPYETSSQTVQAEEDNELEVAAPTTLPQKTSYPQHTTNSADVEMEDILEPESEVTPKPTMNPSTTPAQGMFKEESAEASSPLTHLQNSVNKIWTSRNEAQPLMSTTVEKGSSPGPENLALDQDDVKPESEPEIPDSQEVQQALRNNREAITLD